MLKGHVFSNQLFGNSIFALFINTFLNGNNGISNNYKNGMVVTASGNNVTIDSGAVCIQGRFLEEVTSTTVSAGTDTSYCKLVIEIDLDKQNTDESFVQGAYKIIKGANAYPNLTQTDIVNNNAGVYQYELARFRNSSSGITDFRDMRTFLNFDSIYEEIEQHIQDIDDGSAYVLKQEGKDLSTNDFNNEYKTKLDGIATGATNNTVENVLTSTSTTNALSAAQGRALKLLVDAKQKSITVGTAAPSGGSNGDMYVQYF